MSDWQPIETAPKDEKATIIITDGETVECAEWSDWGKRWLASTGTMKVWEGSDERGGLADAQCNPTHWMPLPEPPTETKAIQAEPSGDMVRCTIRTGTVDMRDLKIKARDAGLLDGLPLPPNYFDR